MLNQVRVLLADFGKRSSDFETLTIQDVQTEQILAEFIDNAHKAIDERIMLIRGLEMEIMHLRCGTTNEANLTAFSRERTEAEVSY